MPCRPYKQRLFPGALSRAWRLSCLSLRSGVSECAAHRRHETRLLRGPMHFIIDRRTLYVAKHPGRFTLDALKAFRANQGLLLAGAVAYYALLSIVPLMILIVIALSRIVPQHVLLSA